MAKDKSTEGAVSARFWRSGCAGVEVNKVGWSSRISLDAEAAEEALEEIHE